MENAIDQTEGLIFPAEHVIRGERPSARKWNQLVEGVNRQARMAPPKNVLRQGRPRIPPTQIIPVTFATWKNLSLQSVVDDPSDAQFEGLNLDSWYANYGKVWALVWLQDDEDENGIYSYKTLTEDERKQGASPWKREYELTLETIGGTQIYVEHGKRFRGFSFVYQGDTSVKIVIDRTVVVASASKESETLSGLGSLITGYDPTAGDLIFVRNQGLYIANTGTWKKVAGLRTFASSESAYGEIASQEISLQTVSSLTCSGTDITANVTTTYHELAVSPSHLYESGDL